jgi:hypothetical protein
VIKSRKNEVRHEESCSVINLGFSDAACGWNDSLGAAAEESPADSLSIK